MPHHRRAAIAASTLLLAVAAWASIPTVGAAASITGVFIDGWPGVAQPYAPVNLAPSTGLETVPTDVSTAYLDSAAGATPGMTLIFQAPAGEALVVGSYSSSTGAFAQTGQIGCFQDEIIDFDVLEIERAGDGTLTRLAIDFSTRCPNWQPPLPGSALGSVRFHSTIGFDAFAITPVRTFPWQPDATLPDQDVGTSGTTTAFTVTNTGSTVLHPSAVDAAVDDLTIGPGTCDGDALAAGASCTVALTFAPTIPGPASMTVSLHVPELARVDRTLRVEGLGMASTAVSLEVDPEFSSVLEPDQGTTAYDVSVSPAGAIGSYELHSTCGIVRQAGGPTMFYVVTPPGPCDAWATFTATAGSGYHDSASDVVSFVQPVRAAVYGTPTSGSWITGNTVTIHVWAGAVNGATPSDGTISLFDAATDSLLASAPVTADVREMDVPVITWTPGVRELRAVYDGGATMVGSTFLLGYKVEADVEAPTVTIHPTDHAGWTQSTSVDLALDTYDLANDVTEMRISNDGTSWFETAFTTPVAWSLVDPAYGGSVDDGLRTIQAQVKDRVGNWSTIATWDVTLDRGQPDGSVAIADGAVAVASTAVTLTVPGSDALSPLAQVALSNDGTTWTTRAYAATQSWTLAAGSGSRTVNVKWKDKAGNWSAVRSDSITVDSTPPTATEPRRGFNTATTVTTGGAISTRIPWSGADVGSGIATYELAMQTDGGTWTTVSSTLTNPSTNRSLVAEHTYRFRVRARDRAGNRSAWAYGETFRVTRRNENNAAITFTGTWSGVSNAAYLGGAARYATTAGAKVTTTFTGRSIAWVARPGPAQGRAEVYVNGTLVTTIDLYASSLQDRRVVWVGSWTTAASRKVTIKVLGTAGRPRVDFDAFVISD